MLNNGTIASNLTSATLVKHVIHFEYSPKKNYKCILNKVRRKNNCVHGFFSANSSLRVFSKAWPYNLNAKIRLALCKLLVKLALNYNIKFLYFLSNKCSLGDIVHSNPFCNLICQSVFVDGQNNYMPSHRFSAIAWKRSCLLCWLARMS